MTAEQKTHTLPSPEHTSALARRLGADLHPGDIVLLSGGIGAGKTHFARSLIQSLLIEPEDVPSPTFTLVQVYDTRHGELWHSDLYRLSGPDDVVELGLVDAFETAICLIEWPDKLEDLMPQNALSLRFTDGPTEAARLLTMDWTDPRWTPVVRNLQA
ncbi:tRNA (adenosine(37)-N6)-threonylcarbamoyltransferase complex ATPase subunit type 1 TsaE [Primorskyibacter sp. 2E107]|uniref:tRNA (adenosine(37)-N6)-threonylcarbamoyltransferase complex ATPase subunit type 1 TsaE n=1 Tax=Primorskyibacter sp. 2E107 TaxID=3403458 RepID=UPI003AF8322F